MVVTFAGGQSADGVVSQGQGDRQKQPCRRYRRVVLIWRKAGLESCFSGFGRRLWRIFEGCRRFYLRFLRWGVLYPGKSGPFSGLPPFSPAPSRALAGGEGNATFPRVRRVGHRMKGGSGQTIVLLALCGISRGPSNRVTWQLTIFIRPRHRRGSGVQA